MKFERGVKVRLIHTGDVGIVTGELSGGMIMVKLDDDFEIPVQEEDLIEEAVAIRQEIAPDKTKDLKKDSNPAGSVNKKFVAANTGVHVCFDPTYNQEGMVESYELFLINDSGYEFIYDLELSFFDFASITKEDVLPPGEMTFIGTMPYDQLNDSPQIDLDYWLLSTAGKEDRVHKILKIKAKQFFKKAITPKMLNHIVHFYTIVEDVKTEKKDTEGLANYTKRNTRPVKYKNPNDRESFTTFSSKEYAEFKPEIDLHIEKLTNNDRKKRSNAEIVRIQLDHFERFMEKAVRLGVPRVFIIHGVGKGHLKNEIATRLLQLGDVKTFKNEFHPRYGWGATEVEL